MMLTLARQLALLGGIALMAMVLITVISILGRSLMRAPIPGDVEMVQFLMAFAISCFLPWCQARQSHVLIGFFTDGCAAWLRDALSRIGCIGLAAMAAVLAWRTLSAAISAYPTGQGSMILGIPVWINTAALVPGFALMAAIAATQAIGHAGIRREHHAEP